MHPKIELRGLGMGVGHWKISRVKMYTFAKPPKDMYILNRLDEMNFVIPKSKTRDVRQNSQTPFLETEKLQI